MDISGLASWRDHTERTLGQFGVLAAQLYATASKLTTIADGLHREVTRLDEHIAQYDQHIRDIARQDARTKRVMHLRGVGETTATGLLAMIGDGRDFDCGRQFAAWLGRAPGQYSSGGKARPGRISKAGGPLPGWLGACAEEVGKSC